MENSEVIVVVAAVLVIGVAAQWVGWRIRVPSIVFLLGAGLIAGPLTGWVDPDALFGELLFPFASLAVAVILFEGAFTLGARGVRVAGRTVWLLLSVGASITLVSTAVVARAVLDVQWSLAWVLAGVLVVTGPTVIGPIIRSIGLKGRVASILEAEGTLIDPLGAIVTVLLFRAFFEPGSGTPLAVELVLTLAIGIVTGVIAAWVLTLALARFLLPDELHNVTTLAMVIAAFAVADHFQPEAGLVATTAMGFVVASQRRVEVRDVLQFNETLRTLFISGLFILLGARIAPETLTTLEWRNLVFLGILVVAVRPLSVVLATIGSGLSRSERTFIAATAPRGIVAAAVASVFSLRLAEQDVDGAQVIVSATFTVIAGTVLLSGLGSRRLARALGLIDDTPAPVVILGTNPFGRVLGELLEDNGTPVRLVSLDRTEVAAVKLSGLPALHGSVLDDELWAEIAETGASAFIAVSSSDEVNVLACRRVASMIGRRNVFRVAPGRKEHSRLNQSAGSAGRLLAGDVTLARFKEMLDDGWQPRVTKLTETFDHDDYDRVHPGAVIIGVFRRNSLDFAAADTQIHPRSGDVVIALTASPSN